LDLALRTGMALSPKMSGFWFVRARRIQYIILVESARPCARVQKNIVRFIHG
jgi:hypothetical protein